MYKLSVIAFPDKPLVMNEVLSFEVKFHLIALVNRLVQTLEHLFLCMAQESFAAHVVVLWDDDLELVSQQGDYFHVNAVCGDDFYEGWRKLEGFLGC